MAIDLDAAVRARFGELQRLLGAAGADVRWVRPDRAHLTLKFLGEATAVQIEAMAAALDEIGPSTAPFEVAFGGTGVFPNPRRPRVLWIGITEGVERLRPLAAAIDEAASAAGFEREHRPFSPHITLGRFRSSSGWERLSGLMDKHAGFDAGRMTAADVRLIESVLLAEGPRYTPLHTAPFSGA